MAKKKQLRMRDRLVLQSFILDLLGVENLDDIAKHLRDDAYFEEFTSDGHTGFFDVLRVHLTKLKIDQAKLEEYDENIVTHTNSINNKRTKPPLEIRWKYFQYLALLFSEIYLDMYFQDEDELLNSLNTYLNSFVISNPDADLDDYEQGQLSNISYWMATGSGKTLIMHVNALQFAHYLKKYGKSNDIDQFILLTPKPALSVQHLADFIESGFSKTSLMEKNKAIKLNTDLTPEISILHIHQLKSEVGPTTFETEEFESRNFLMVDEGHLGSTSGIGEWRTRREQICSDGFSMEYSATFEQAVANPKAREAKIDQAYSKNIIIDYSYAKFYEDGYGKDYDIHNLRGVTESELQFKYLTAAVITFLQQMRLFHDNPEGVKILNIERPLWIFVGSSVNALRSKTARSDIQEIVAFFIRFLGERDQTISLIDEILNGSPGLIDERTHKEMFSEKFPHLEGTSAEDVYDEAVRSLFNASFSGKLVLEYLTGETGEMLLRVGDNEPFGVIDVGDSATFKKITSESNLDIDIRTIPFSQSYFQDITDNPDCPVNVLIGSNKFIEGWSCWRVSMMGVMNMGKKSGSKIIQLFGRGVRLKGHEFSLKRSRMLSDSRVLSDIPALESFRYLETLNIFGLKSNYMEDFLRDLVNEGIEQKEMIDVTINTITELPEIKLKNLVIDDSINFITSGQIVQLSSIPPEALIQRNVILDLHPRLGNLSSIHSEGGETQTLQKRVLNHSHLALIDWNQTYKKLLERKTSRNYHNILINKADIEQLFDHRSWYTLYCPSSTLEVSNLSQKIQIWQNIVDSLALSYLDRVYTSSNDQWQRENNLTIKLLTEDDPNLICEWTVSIESSKGQLILKVQELRDNYVQGNHNGVTHNQFRGTQYNRHLYNPLLYMRTGVENTELKISPAPLNEGEDDFVKDLHDYYTANEKRMIEHEMYLLRNQSKTGIGFFTAGNFFPDFIMWLIVGDHQYITFIDPKGLYHARSLEYPKIELASRMDEITNDIRARNNDNDITLHSFIISVTTKDGLGWGRDLEKSDFTDRNVLFQKDDKTTYIETMLNIIIPEIVDSSV